MEGRWIRGRGQSRDAMIREKEMGNDEKEMRDRIRGEGGSDY